MFYFMDRQFKTLGVADVSPFVDIHISNDIERVEEESGTLQFTATMNFTPETMDKVKRMTELGNYIAYPRYNGKIALVSIMEFSHNPTEGTRDITCEDAGLDLLNNVVKPFNQTQAMSLRYYLNEYCLRDTGFVVGECIYPESLKKALKFEDTATAVERMKQVIEAFGGGKFEFDFVFKNLQVDAKRVNIVEELGTERPDITLRVGRDVNSIQTTGTIYDMFTAVEAYGNKPENSNSRISLSGYPWTDPDKRFKLQNGVLVDTVEAPKWSRLGTSTGGYITRAKIYEADNQGDLLAMALDDLRNNSSVKYNYEVDVASAPETLMLGDRVDIVDEQDSLFMSGRVLVTERSEADDSFTITLGDFLLKYDELDEQYKQMAEEFEKQFDENIPVIVDIIPSSQFFVNGVGTIKLKCTVTKGVNDITDSFTKFEWHRQDQSGDNDPNWVAYGKEIDVMSGSSDVYTYTVTVDY